MRQQSKKQITIRDRVLGGSKPLICLPLVAATLPELLEEAKILTTHQPDLIEWRIDGFASVNNLDECLAAQKALREVIDTIPLIYTCRIDAEGGMTKMDQRVRQKLIIAAMEAGGIEIIDIELCNGPEFIGPIRKKASECGVALILSFHNFKETPSEQFIVEKLEAQVAAGADIAKLAVMPKSYTDVLTLLNATNRARNTSVEVPIITMSMGGEGQITRLAGGLFGSDVTFAIGKTASAPGQIPIAELRSAMKIIY